MLSKPTFAYLIGVFDSPSRSGSSSIHSRMDETASEILARRCERDMRGFLKAAAAATLLVAFLSLEMLFDFALVLLSAAATAADASLAAPFTAVAAAVAVAAAAAAAAAAEVVAE